MANGDVERNPSSRMDGTSVIRIERNSPPSAAGTVYVNLSTHVDRCIDTLRHGMTSVTVVVTACDSV